MALRIARELLGARDEMFSSPRLQTGYLLHEVRLGSARIRSNATSAAVAKVECRVPRHGASCVHGSYRTKHYAKALCPLHSLGNRRDPAAVPLG